MFIILCLVLIVLAALSLVLLIRRIMKDPPSTRRSLVIAGLIVGALVGTPIVLFILFTIKYVFFDAWH
jgi:hypothetical protein